MNTSFAKNGIPDISAWNHESFDKSLQTVHDRYAPIVLAAIIGLKQDRRVVVNLESRSLWINCRLLE